MNHPKFFLISFYLPAYYTQQILIVYNAYTKRETVILNLVYNYVIIDVSQMYPVFPIII